jgi:hypothetical protein
VTCHRAEKGGKTCIFLLALSTPFTVHSIVETLIHRQNTPMPEITRKSRATTRCPHVTLRVRALVGSVSVAAIKVEENMNFTVDLVVPVRRRALDG